MSTASPYDKLNKSIVDLLVEVVSASRDDFLAFLDQHIYGQPDIDSVEVMSGLKNFKNQFLLKRNWS